MKLSEILNDHKSGSTVLLKNILNYLKEHLNMAEDAEEFLFTVLEQVQTAHPFMSVFPYLENYYLRFKTKTDLPALLRDFEQHLKEIQQHTLTNANKFLADFRSFATISRSSLVEQFFSQLKDHRTSFHLLESAPMREGISLAKKLAKTGNPVFLYVDSAMERVVRRVDAILIGADVIQEDGIFNKIGSFPLALIAREYEKPFYILADTSKWWSDFQYKETMDQHPVEEVCSELPGVKIRNPYFEKVPGRLISGWISEKGFTQFPISWN